MSYILKPCLKIPCGFP
uniref:Uncharacterized protein n=1 Tax=Rhizophora mucronata TaxID=61149 RepID=A0A2P2NTK2_RHIMU